MISPTYIMISPRYWVSPTLLKITTHGTHDIPYGTEHSPPPPSVLKISSTFIMIYSKYPPTVLMISPTVMNTHYVGWSKQLTPSTRVSWQKKLWISKTSLWRFWFRFLSLYQLEQNKETRRIGGNILNLIILKRRKQSYPSWQWRECFTCTERWETAYCSFILYSWHHRKGLVL